MFVLPGAFGKETLFLRICFLFARMASKDCEVIKGILDDYGLASGQAVNFNKSVLCVSKSVSKVEGARLASILGVKLIDCHERYLGLPSFASSNKKHLLGIGGFLDRLPLQFSPPPKLDQFATVSSLLSPTGGWNISLVRDFFLKEDADAILSLPTGSVQIVDDLLWHYKKSSCYSVRSGYKIGCEKLSLASSSGLGCLEEWWKTLWRLRIPAKVKIFIWKACNNWLPTAWNLMKLKLDVDPFCPVCRRKPESMVHAVIHNTSSQNDMDVIGWSRNFLESFRAANSLPETGHENNLVTIVKWNKPNKGCFKANTDASVNKNDVALGLVASFVTVEELCVDLSPTNFLLIVSASC
ncbi:hypothetical protein LWI28_003582 [Acer negundo]|uniref:Reverse transcriptase zinc-binding domain-containing protein n=1 Tax=Acer negundo TaxID=4023 RepID=A0AAD5J2R5_ACENE|nr:hypothetical protein LWI28_003582 [Acer negundo]